MRTARRIVSGVLVLSLVAGGWFAFINRQWIADYLSVQQFTASEPIAQLAGRSGMSEKGVNLRPRRAGYQAEGSRVTEHIALCIHSR